jgi:hypothetical protein
MFFNCSTGLNYWMRDSKDSRPTILDGKFYILYKATKLNEEGKIVVDTTNDVETCTLVRTSIANPEEV